MHAASSQPDPANGRLGTHPLAHPALAGLVLAVGASYPWLLDTLSTILPSTPRNPFVGFVAVAGTFLAPALGLRVFTWLASQSDLTVIDYRTKRASLGLVVAPSFYVLAGVLVGNWSLPFTDKQAWLAIWSILALFVLSGSRSQSHLIAPHDERRTLRLAHGWVAAALLLFIGFHLANHLAALAGPPVHKALMDAGRVVYRAGVVEPLLIALFLAQIGMGAVLVQRWLLGPADRYRALQAASGIAIGAYAITHVNSALVSARWLKGIDTDWGWASGAPEGLLYDSWSIRLIPHYGLAVVMVGVHLACGLRTVLIAHSVEPRAANSLWWLSVALSIVVAIAILAALLGLRI